MQRNSVNIVLMVKDFKNKFIVYSVPVTMIVRTAAWANSFKTAALSGFNLFSKTTNPNLNLKKLN